MAALSRAGSLGSGAAGLGSRSCSCELGQLQAPSVLQQQQHHMSRMMAPAAAAAAAAPGSSSASGRPLSHRSRAVPRLPGRSRLARQARVVVRAQLNGPKGLVASVRSGCTRFLARYDPIATGVGALSVAGYCMVVHEQPVGEALNIAAAATVLGMVMQELLASNDEPGANGSL